MLFIITGSCGSGKSTLLPFLKRQLPDFAVFDFDDADVPENPSLKWRQNTTRYWLEKADELIIKGCSVILVGLIIPREIEMLNKKKTEIRLCLLDLDERERKKRLLKRQASTSLIIDVEELIGLRHWVKESKYPHYIVDSSNKTPQQTSKEIIKWIKSVNI